MTATWVPFALAIQLVFAFFAPPFALGKRNVFLADLWCMAWVAFSLLDRRRLKALWPWLLVSALVVLIAWAQGNVRPSLVGEFKTRYFFEMSESDLFDSRRELAVAMRFISWLWAARLVVAFKLGRNERAITLGTLAGCLAVAGCLMLADFVFPSFRALLGHVYGFDPEFEYWRGRAYGPFRSPLEGGVALCLGAILVARARELPLRFRVVSVFFALAGAIASKTFTVAVAGLLTALVVVLPRYRKKLARSRAHQIGFAACLAGAAVFAVTSNGVSARLHDFAFRFGPWQFMIETMARDPRSLLFGYGFAPYHSDNIYVWIFIRGGLFALVFFLWSVGRAVARGWPIWLRTERAIVIFLATTALVLDAFIYRHVVSIMLAVGFPLLTRWNKPSAPPEKQARGSDISPSSN